MTQERIAALVAALPRVRKWEALICVGGYQARELLASEALDSRTGYLPALEAVAALAERERRLREALEQISEAHIDNAHGQHCFEQRRLARRALLAEAQEETT